MTNDPTRPGRQTARPGDAGAADVARQDAVLPGVAAEHLLSAESARNEAERFRQLAEEAREVSRPASRSPRSRQAGAGARPEAAEVARVAGEDAREAAEFARDAGEEAREAAETARHAAMDAVQATADSLKTTLESMKSSRRCGAPSFTSVSSTRRTPTDPCPLPEGRAAHVAGRAGTAKTGDIPMPQGPQPDQQHRATLRSIARRAMLERGLLPSSHPRSRPSSRGSRHPQVPTTSRGRSRDSRPQAPLVGVHRQRRLP